MTAPEDRHELDDQLAVVRARLGDDEYEQVIAHGAGMSLDGVIDTMVTAIEDALAKLPSGTDSRAQAANRSEYGSNDAAVKRTGSSNP